MDSVPAVLSSYNSFAYSGDSATLVTWRFPTSAGDCTQMVEGEFCWCPRLSISANLVAEEFVTAGTNFPDTVSSGLSP